MFPNQVGITDGPGRDRLLKAFAEGEPVEFTVNGLLYGITVIALEKVGGDNPNEFGIRVKNDFQSDIHGPISGIYDVHTRKGSFHRN